jgi:hypothetical protein
MSNKKIKKPIERKAKSLFVIFFIPDKGTPDVFLNRQSEKLRKVQLSKRSVFA